jgi:hypothetical protein
MAKPHFSDCWYSISPKMTRHPKVRKALHAKLKEHFKHGSDTAFATQQDGVDALKAAGLSLDDYDVCETCSANFGL